MKRKRSAITNKSDSSIIQVSPLAQQSSSSQSEINALNQLVEIEVVPGLKGSEEITEEAVEEIMEEEVISSIIASIEHNSASTGSTFLLPLSGKAGAGKNTTVDEKYKPQLEQFLWSLNGSNGYVLGFYQGKVVYLARLVMEWHLGRKLTKKEEVDHVDRNKLNNTTHNLRLANRLFNLMNRGKQRNNTSGYIGVVLVKPSTRYKAVISLRGKSKHLGSFSTAVEAALAYNQALRKRNDVPGEFKQYNLIVDTQRMHQIDTNQSN